MTGARIEAAADDVWRLSGELDFASVPAVWSQLEPGLSDSPKLELSLQGVTRSNSAGLVLLLHALDVSRRRGCSLKIRDVPQSLLDLARVSGCEGLLGADLR